MNTWKKLMVLSVVALTAVAVDASYGMSLEKSQCEVDQQQKYTNIIDAISHDDVEAVMTNGLNGEDARCQLKRAVDKFAKIEWVNDCYGYNCLVLLLAWHFGAMKLFNALAYYLISESEYLCELLRIIHHDENLLPVLDLLIEQNIGQLWMAVALYHAENIECVKKLLDANAGMELCLGPDDNTALIYAALKNEWSDKMRLLLAAGANINARDKMGRTALMSAAYVSNVRAVRMLLDAYYYRIDLMSIKTTDRGAESVMQIVKDRWEACPLELFPEYIMMPFVDDISEIVNVKDAQGHTALWYAIKARDEAAVGSKAIADAEEVIRMLEEAGATE